MNNPPLASTDDFLDDSAFSEAAITVLERALPVLLAAGRDSADVSAEEWTAYLTGSLPESDAADLTRRVVRDAALRQRMRTAMQELRDAQGRPALFSPKGESVENREILSPIAQAWARWREGRINALLQRFSEGKRGGEETPFGEDSVGKTLRAALTEQARRTNLTPPARVALARGSVGAESEDSRPGSFSVPFYVGSADGFPEAEPERETLTLNDLRWEQGEITLTIAPLSPRYEKYSGGAVELQLILTPHQRQTLGKWPLPTAVEEQSGIQFAAPFIESAEARDLLSALLRAVLVPPSD